jgi:hypothetical protein
MENEGESKRASRYRSEKLKSITYDQEGKKYCTYNQKKEG